ncbi:MAG: aminotransferase class I/II-fold pyridoxal phosphate-dependent enzyme [Nitrospirota bacterium]
MSSEISLDAPNIGEREKEYLNRALESGYVSTVGPFVPEFEGRFALYLDVPCAVSTQSGTAALHMALHELGIGQGDEVIVPALTFVATVNPLMYAGARPVFVDVDPSTWNIAPEAIEKSITKKTKAIIPVHLYGNPCDMDSLMTLAARHGLSVVEDATESLGARFGGRATGTFGDMGCFSFNGNKIITTGGGGMVVGRDDQRMGHIKFLVNQARDEEKGYYHPEIGFNYRMTNIEAALGLAQMARLEEFLAKKRAFNRLYREALAGIDGILFQQEYRDAESSCWLTCITVERAVDMPALQEALRARGLPTRRLFMPITEFPPYHRCSKGDLSATYRLYERSLCLPSSTLNTANDIQHACSVLREILER